MSFDIYGNNLKRGHCEVHSHIAEEYPCSVCMQESQLKKVASNAQLKQWELEDLVQVLESRIKELENTRTQSQWISVEDRLPDELESVLSFSNYDGIHQSIYRSRTFKKSLVVWDHEKVTHWMPLPAAPKVGE